MLHSNLFININKALPIYIIILSALESIIFLDIRGFLFLLGGFFSEVLNAFLKYNIFKPLYHLFGTFKNNGYYLPLFGRGDRPNGARHCNWFDNCNECNNNNTPLKSFGMPSGHSQFVMYCATFLILYLYFTYVHKKSGDGIMTKASHIRTFFYPISIFIATLSLLAVYTRIILKCHTIQQVILGSLIGIKCGILYFFTVKRYFI